MARKATISVNGLARSRSSRPLPKVGFVGHDYSAFRLHSFSWGSVLSEMPIWILSESLFLNSADALTGLS